MNVLFVHQNFPGQYVHLAPALAEKGHTVVGLGENSNLQGRADLPGVQRVGYQAPQAGSPQTHPYIRNFEGQVRRGQQVARSLLALQERGFVPDLICAHPGWGEALYIKDVFPGVPLVGLFEFYYHGRGQDVGFDPEFDQGPERSLDTVCRIRTKNTTNLLALEAIDIGVCPTEYQKSVMPAALQPKLRVVHDGINTAVARPNPAATLTISGGQGELKLDRAVEVITFVNRNLEPYRGYHRFMRCLPKLLQQRPLAQVVIVGGDGVSYGAAAPDCKTWKEIFWQEVETEVDGSRVHFVGRIPYRQLIALFQISRVHVYLTYPFVLSWSMLEAMSCGCLVIGSRTAPVEEIIQSGVNGLLVDFFKADELVQQINNVLDHPTQMQDLREQARATIVQNYDLARVCLPQQLSLLETLMES